MKLHYQINNESRSFKYRLCMHIHQDIDCSIGRDLHSKSIISQAHKNEFSCVVQALPFRAQSKYLRPILIVKFLTMRSPPGGRRVRILRHTCAPQIYEWGNRMVTLYVVFFNVLRIVQLYITDWFVIKFLHLCNCKKYSSINRSILVRYPTMRSNDQIMSPIDTDSFFIESRNKKISAFVSSEQYRGRRVGSTYDSITNSSCYKYKLSFAFF